MFRPIVPVIARKVGTNLLGQYVLDESSHFHQVRSVSCRKFMLVTRAYVPHHKPHAILVFEGQAFRAASGLGHKPLPTRIDQLAIQERGGLKKFH